MSTRGTRAPDKAEALAAADRDPVPKQDGPGSALILANLSSGAGVDTPLSATSATTLDALEAIFTTHGAAALQRAVDSDLDLAGDDTTRRMAGARAAVAAAAAADSDAASAPPPAVAVAAAIAAATERRLEAAGDRLRTLLSASGGRGDSRGEPLQVLERLLASEAARGRLDRPFAEVVRQNLEAARARGWEVKAAVLGLILRRCDEATGGGGG